MRETLRKRQIWLDAGHWSMECENEVAYLTSALHHLEAGKRDTDRLNWMESNESTGFERWSTGWGVSDHSFPDLRQAIDFEMGGKP